MSTVSVSMTVRDLFEGHFSSRNDPSATENLYSQHLGNRNIVHSICHQRRN